MIYRYVEGGRTTSKAMVLVLEPVSGLDGWENGRGALLSGESADSNKEFLNLHHSSKELHSQEASKILRIGTAGKWDRNIGEAFCGHCALNRIKECFTFGTYSSCKEIRMVLRDEVEARAKLEGEKNHPTVSSTSDGYELLLYISDRD